MFLSCDDSHDSSGLKGSIVLRWVRVDSYLLHKELLQNYMHNEWYLGADEDVTYCAIVYAHVYVVYVDQD